MRAKLGFEFETHAELVAALVKVFAVDGCGQSESNSGMHFANEAETDDALVVDTCLDLSVGVHTVEAAK